MDYLINLKTRRSAKMIIIVTFCLCLAGAKTARAETIAFSCREPQVEALGWGRMSLVFDLATSQVQQSLIGTATTYRAQVSPTRITWVAGQGGSRSNNSFDRITAQMTARGLQGELTVWMCSRVQ